MNEQNQEWEVGDIIEERFNFSKGRTIHYLLMEQCTVNRYVFTALDMTYGVVINYSFEPDPRGHTTYRRLA